MRVVSSPLLPPHLSIPSCYSSFPNLSLSRDSLLLLQFSFSCCCLELQGVRISASTEGFSSSSCSVFINKASSSCTFFLLLCKLPLLSIGMPKYILVLHILVVNKNYFCIACVIIFIFPSNFVAFLKFLSSLVVGFVGIVHPIFFKEWKLRGLGNHPWDLLCVVAHIFHFSDHQSQLRKGRSQLFCVKVESVG